MLLRSCLPTFMCEILCSVRAVLVFAEHQVVLGCDGKGSFCIDEYVGLEGLEERINSYMDEEGTDSDGYWIHCHIGVICDSLPQC